MAIYDAILVLIVLVWWLRFRSKYDWRAVVLFYVGGLFVTDIFCAIVILLTYRSHPTVTNLPALLMPIGGIAALLYARGKDRLRWEARLLTKTGRKQ